MSWACSSAEQRARASGLQQRTQLLLRSACMWASICLRGGRVVPSVPSHMVGRMKAWEAREQLSYLWGLRSLSKLSPRTPRPNMSDIPPPQKKKQMEKKTWMIVWNGLSISWQISWRWSFYQHKEARIWVPRVEPALQIQRTGLLGWGTMGWQIDAVLTRCLEKSRKYPYVCHGKLNAITNRRADVKGCRVCVALFPCNECAKLIIQAVWKKLFSCRINIMTVKRQWLLG